MGLELEELELLLDLQVELGVWSAGTANEKEGQLSGCSYPDQKGS